MSEAGGALEAAIMRLEQVRQALASGETPDGELEDLANEAVRLAGEVSSLVTAALRAAEHGE